MQNIFVEFLPPWIETGLQPAFYDKESGTVLQQVARMYAKVNYLVEMFNTFSKDTTDFVNDFVDSTNTEIERFEHDTTETVNDYIEKFTQLKDFVDDYFENLDVQEEINNKLDDMVESGTLQEIITQYINTTALWMFDNVAGMKLATNLTNGSFCKTLGYSSKNDDGGAIYKIRTKTNDDTTDEKILISLYDTNLVAELCKNNIMNVKQFGAKGDGVTDDTDSIQKAVNYVSTIEVPNGTYMVNAITHINLNSGNQLTLNENAIIKAITTDQGGYIIINLDNVNNVKISGGTIQGDKDTHTGTSGEWGNCINVMNGCTDIHIENVKLIDAWGDGLYINNVTNITSSNLYIDNCRRNGISVISVSNYLSDNDIIKNIIGTNPQFGVDVEPNSATDVLKNITFRNLQTYSCHAGGFLTSLQNLTSTSERVNIKLINYTDTSSPCGIRLIKSPDVIGELEVVNSSLIENINNAIQFRNWQYNSKFNTRINGLNVYRSSVESNTTNNSAIHLLGTTKGGNITLENLYIEQTGVGASCYDVYLAAQYDTVSIVNPIHRTYNYHAGANGANFHLIDGNEVCKVVSGAPTGGVGVSEVRSMSIRNANSTSDQTVSFSASAPTGFKCLFAQNNPSTGKYQIQLPENTYCYAFSDQPAPLIKLGGNASVTLQRISATEIIALSYCGTITV